MSDLWETVDLLDEPSTLQLLGDVTFVKSQNSGECRCISPGAVARACNPSYREAEAGGSFELRSSELQRTMPIGCPH